MFNVQGFIECVYIQPCALYFLHPSFSGNSTFGPECRLCALLKKFGSCSGYGLSIFFLFRAGKMRVLFLCTKQHFTVVTTKEFGVVSWCVEQGTRRNDWDIRKQKLSGGSCFGSTNTTPLANSLGANTLDSCASLVPRPHRKASGLKNFISNLSCH